ncbi:MAG: TVP38/TMEM64 family protein [Oscillospiraceae bacterium]|nr:TVP38/TMEM64 family protein [Oscillospiraceae bacterium]
MKKTTLHLILRIALLIAVLIPVIFLTVRYLLPMSSLLTTAEGREEICFRIESYGIWAPLIYVLLMASQIVIAFIPGGPLEIVAGMLFGGLKGTLWTMIGSVLGSFAVYGLVKCFGRPLVHFFVSEEKMQKFTILHDEKRLAFWVFILFLIPGIPKDMLTYIVPLTKMRPGQFLLLSNTARFPAIVASVFLGDSLSEGRYWLCIVIACVAAICIFAGFRLKTTILKDKGET